MKEDINSSNCLHLNLPFELTNSMSDLSTNFFSQKSKNDEYKNLTELLSNVNRIL